MPLDALEYVVRPYQTPDAFGRIIIPSSPMGTREKATLTWGGGNVTPPARKEASADGENFEVVCCKENLNELDRKSETKRIFQHGDTSSDNWVDVERPQSLRLRKKDQNKCGDDWTQISGVAQEVSSALDEFEAAIHTGTTSVGGDPKNCAVKWNFKNE